MCALGTGVQTCALPISAISPNSVLRSGARQRVQLYESCLEFDTAARTYFAGGANYGAGYRWESAASSMLWGVRARDIRAVRPAAGDFWRCSSLWSFLDTGFRSMEISRQLLRLLHRVVQVSQGVTGQAN